MTHVYLKRECLTECWILSLSLFSATRPRIMSHTHKYLLFLKEHSDQVQYEYKCAKGY